MFSSSHEGNQEGLRLRASPLWYHEIAVEYTTVINQWTHPCFFSLYMAKPSHAEQLFVWPLLLRR